VLNLVIQNLVSPISRVDNLIGFETLPSGDTLTGKMKIVLANVYLKTGSGNTVLLTSANALHVGKVRTQGVDVNVDYEKLP